MLDFGEELFRLTSAAYRTGTSDSDLQNSLYIVAMLDVLTGGDEKVLRQKIALCDKIVSVNDRFKLMAILISSFRRFNLLSLVIEVTKWYSILIRTAALALGTQHRATQAGST